MLSLMLIAIAIAIAIAAAATAAALATARAPKIYISVDLEGVAGVVSSEQLGPSGFEYERFRRFMTDELLAAIEGARAAGAGDILVSDSHGNGQSLLIEHLPDDVELVRSWPRPLAMMEGIDASFDGAMFVGYHSAATNRNGVLAHTMSGARFADFRLHNTSVAESALNAAIAGHYDVPVIMLSGDDAAVAEAKALLGNIETATVKHAISFTSARCKTPAAARKLIRDAATRAVRNIANAKPFKLTTPVPVRLVYKDYRPPQVLELLPLFSRPESHSIEFTAADMPEVSRIVQFLTHFGGL